MEAREDLVKGKRAKGQKGKKERQKGKAKGKKGL
jgi:hypothetical protein